MLFRVSVYGLVTLLGGVALLMLAYIGFRRRKARAATEFALLMIALAICGIGLSLESMSLTLERAMLWKYVQFLGVPWIPMLAVLFGLRLCDVRLRHERALVIVLATVSALFMVVELSNDFHELFHAQFRLQFTGRVAVIGYEPGPFMYGYAAYLIASVLTLIGLMLSRALESSAVFRRQALLIGVAALISLFANVVSLAGLTTSQLDITPLSFVILAGIVAYALFHEYLFDLTPVALRQVFLTMPAGCVILDADMRLVEFNAAAATAFPGMTERAIGSKPWSILAPWPELRRRLFGSEPFSIDLVSHDVEPERCYHVSVSSIPGRGGAIIARILMIHDTTEQYRLAERLRQLASYDELTGALNRRTLFAEIDRMLARLARTGATITLAMIDIDYFKRVNDALGHQAGDEVLREVAKRIFASMRASDILCRFGGEEFLAVLPDTGTDAARTVAERMRADVCGTSIDVTSGRWDVAVAGQPVFASTDLADPIPSWFAGSFPSRAAGARPAAPQESLTVTISIGLVSANGSGIRRRDELITMADRALYRAKANGRNRVEAWEVGPPGCCSIR